MRIAHIGSTGKVGTRIREELLRRGHSVTAISRHPEKAAADPRVTTAMGDITSPAALAPVLRGHDAIVSSVTFIPGTSALLLEAVVASGVKRYVAVGGAGSLETSPGKLLKESPSIPPEWLPAINEGAAMLALLRANDGLDWSYFSPAGLIGPGERTGQFRLGGDQLIVDANGKSAISYEDYAIALVDELEKPRHVRRRFTIGY